MYSKPRSQGGNRNKKRLALPGLLALFAGGCRVTGDFRVGVRPDPVPRNSRTGWAHYYYVIDSLARRPVRVGPEGPLLEPGGRLVLPRDLPPGRCRDELVFFEQGREIAGRVTVEVRTVPGDPAAARDWPLPDLGGQPPVVTAGFHAPNHRQPGHREALDLVPMVPPGTHIFGLPVASPFAGRVLAVSSVFPDVPGGRPNEIIVRADDGRVWRFAHLRQHSIGLRPGERFRPGDRLGEIGLSGQTTGPHLHMELLGTTQRP